MGRQRHHVRYLCFTGMVRGFGLSAYSFCLTFVISDHKAVRLCVWFGASIYSDSDMNASGRSV